MIMLKRDALTHFIVKCIYGWEENDEKYDSFQTAQTHVKIE